MKRLLPFFLLIALAGCTHAQVASPPAFANGLGPGYQDVTETATPAAPPASTLRLYADSTSHTLTCIKNGGSNCLFDAGSLSGTAVTITSLAAGDVLSYNGSAWVNSVLGIATSRTVANTGATYATTDRNKRVIRTLTSAQTDTVPAISASYPDAFLFQIINAGSATITLQTGYTGFVYPGETATMRSNGTTWEKSSQYSGIIPQQRLEHVITLNIGATGAGGVFFEADYACTIYKATVTGQASGTAQIDVWKHAAGTIPSAGDKISGTGWTPLSGAQLLQDSTSTLSGWSSVTVAKGDLFGWTSTLTTMTGATVQLFCH